MMMTAYPTGYAAYHNFVVAYIFFIAKEHVLGLDRHQLSIQSLDQLVKVVSFETFR